MFIDDEKDHHPLWFRLRNIKFKHCLAFMLAAVALEVATLFILGYL
jgi:hypothetical protein